MNEYIIDGNFNVLPNKSGVYAFFYPLRIFDLDSFDSFMHRMHYFLNHSLHTNESNKILEFNKKTSWEIIDFIFNIRHGNSPLVKGQWDRIKNDTVFKKTLLELSFWTKPIYVGQSINLYNRINDEHLSYKSDFAKNFKKICEKYDYNNDPQYRFASALTIKNLLLSYKYLQQTEKEIKSVEKILQLTCKPNLSIK